MMLADVYLLEVCILLNSLCFMVNENLQHIYAIPDKIGIISYSCENSICLKCCVSNMGISNYLLPHHLFICYSFSKEFQTYDVYV